MNQEIAKITNEADQIVKHLEGSRAGKYLRRVQKMLVEGRQNGLAPEDMAALSDIKIKLQLAGFDGIPDTEAAEVFRSHILDFYKFDVPLAGQLVGRYLWQGSYQKNEQRRILKDAILQNNEKIGPWGIGIWLKLYDAGYDQNETEERQKSDIMKFFTEQEDAQKLSPVQKAVLADIIKTYNELIFQELVDADEIADMLEYLEEHPDEQLVKTVSPSSRISDDGTVSKLEESQKVGEYLGVQAAVRQATAQMQREGSEGALTLTMAMAKYPNLGEQSVTFNPIKLRSFPQLVRPSVKNWINDYYENIGAEKHGVMERGNFLFNSPNAKKLTNLERQQLGYILKALDEDSIVTVDAAKQEVVYPVVEKEEAVPVAAAPAAVKFTSPHQFPSERHVPTPPRRPGFMSPIVEGNGSGANPGPDPRLSGNVVDLKN